MRSSFDPQTTIIGYVATIRHRIFGWSIAKVSTLALVMSASGVVCAQDLVPIADASSRGGAYAAQNAGRSPSLVVKNSQHAAYDRWSYLKFDLGQVQAPIGKAVLVLSVRSLDGAGTVEVDAASDHWTETAIRGNRRPAHGQRLAAFKVARVGQVVVDVTDYVRAELRGDRQASFMLQAPVANERYLSFHSRESGKAPLLLIDRGGTSRNIAAPAALTTRQPAVDAVPAGPWTRCGDHGDTCNVPGSINQAHQIRFGADNDYVYKTIFLASTYSRLGCGPYDGVDPAPGRTKHCDYGPALMTPLPAPTNPMGPAVDRSAIPAGDPGTLQVLAKPTTESNGQSDGNGSFRTVCMFSHMNFDDPIVYPGQPGRSHLHAYFGNTSTNANSTQKSIETTGNSTCRGGILNRSAYWVPSVIDTRTGRPVAPIENLIYYKTGYAGVPAALVQVPPPGLRMVAGDMTASARQTPVGMGWWCSNVSYPTTDSIPATCTAGNDLVMMVYFPQCWDGVNLDSPNHKSHMAYPTGNTANGCPASHPVPLPEITYSVHFPVQETGETAYWRLSSDMYSASLPGGFSVHGDWMNGWQPEAIRTFVRNCNNPPADCHAHLLGDGREMYFDPSLHQTEADLLQTPDVKLRRR